MNQKKAIRIGGIILLCASLILVWRLLINKEKSGNRQQKTSEYPIHAQTRQTFTDLKHETLSFVYYDDDTTLIDVAFIEFRMYDHRHALIVRRDSLVGIISVSDPNLNRTPINEVVLQQSRVLLNFLDQNIKILPFETKNRKSPNFHLQGIIVQVHPNDEEIKQLHITQKNFQDPYISRILGLIAGLISKINNQEIPIEDLITTTN